ncbi:MAG: GxxExxY protein [Phycisphaerales bacterium]
MDNERTRTGPSTQRRDHDRGDRYDEERRGRRRGTPLSDLDPALTNVSRIVIGSSIEVHKAIGPGFPDEVYLNALCMELDAAGVKYSVDHHFEVKYKGRVVGKRRVSLFVDNRFVVEVLAVHREIGSLERAQVRAALRCADLELGLIINFAELRVKDGLVRVLNPDKLDAMREAAGGGEGGYDDGGFDEGAGPAAGGQS